MNTKYAITAAEGLLQSVETYGERNDIRNHDGQPAGPTWYINRLKKVLYANGDTLPGDDTISWVGRWSLYAQNLINNQEA